MKVTTKQIPLAQVYGIEAILHIEIEIPLHCIAIEARLPASQSIYDQVLMLEGLNKTRHHTTQHIQTMARRLSAQHIEIMARSRKVAFDKLYKNRSLNRTSLVMLQDGTMMNF